MVHTSEQYHNHLHPDEFHRQAAGKNSSLKQNQRQPSHDNQWSENLSTLRDGN